MTKKWAFLFTEIYPMSFDVTMPVLGDWKGDHTTFVCKLLQKHEDIIADFGLTLKVKHKTKMLIT